MNRLRLLVIAAVVSVPAHAQAPDDTVPLAWKVAKDTLLRFKVEPWPVPKDEAARKGKKLPKALGADGERYGVTDRMLGTTGESLYTRSRTWLPLFIALQLPDKRVKSKRSFRLKRTFDELGNIRNIEVSVAGKEVENTTVDGLVCRTFKLRAVIKDVSRKTDARKWTASGQLQGRMHFHPRGHVIGGEVDLIWDLKEPKNRKAEPKTYRRRYKFQLDLVLELESPRLDKLVIEAIKGGVKFLEKKQNKKTGAWKTTRTKTYPAGQAALGALALLSSDVKADDKGVVKAMKIALEAPLKKVYSVACTLMAIEAAHAPSAEALEKMKPEERVAALAKLPAGLSAVEQKYVSTATQWLMESCDKGRRWGYPYKATSYSYDNSCSQYAALGLLSARRLGGKVPVSIWSQIVNHWLADQDPAGKAVDVVGEGGSVEKRSARGWSYRRRARYSYKTYGSMTCAGVASLAIARAELTRAGKLPPTSKRRAKIDRAINDGLAWLQRNFRIDRHPEHDKDYWHYYYLYGLERAGMLTGTKLLGERDWYREGAAWLVTQRRDTQGWDNGVNETCFALLFLKKATRPLIAISTGKK